MRKRNIVLSVAAVPAVAVLISSCAPAAVPNSNLTVQCTETLVPDPELVTGGNVVGTGHCTMTGLLHDSGPTTDYRTLSSTKIIIRRTVTFAKGTITFVITIYTVGSGGEKWTITSRPGLRGRGRLNGQPGHLRAEGNRIPSLS